MFDFSCVQEVICLVTGGNTPVCPEVTRFPWTSSF